MHVHRFVLPALVLFLSIFAGTKIFAQAPDTIVSYACEGKSGLLSSINDGWSQKTECKGEGQRLVRLGNQGPNGTGVIMFIYRPAGDYVFVLTRDGNIYSQLQKNGWNSITPNDPNYPDSLPAEVPPTSVSQWMLTYLLDKDGNIWLYERGPRTWLNIGHP